MQARLAMFLISGMLLLGACQPSQPSTGSSPTPRPGTTPTPASSPTPAVTPTASPVTSASPVQGKSISFVERKIDWGTLNAAEKARFIVQDFDGRKLVARYNPQDVPAGGEFSFSWDAPPAVIALDPGVELNFAAKINAVPSTGTGSAINLETFPAEFFEQQPATRATQNVGRMSDGSLAEGSLKFRLRPVGLNNNFFKDNTDVVIAYSIPLGPVISYHYRITR